MDQQNIILQGHSKTIKKSDSLKRGFLDYAKNSINSFFNKDEDSTISEPKEELEIDERAKETLGKGLELNEDETIEDNEHFGPLCTLLDKDIKNVNVTSPGLPENEASVNLFEDVIKSPILSVDEVDSPGKFDATQSLLSTTFLSEEDTYTSEKKVLQNSKYPVDDFSECIDKKNEVLVDSKQMSHQTGNKQAGELTEAKKVCAEKNTIPMNRALGCDDRKIVILENLKQEPLDDFQNSNMLQAFSLDKCSEHATRSNIDKELSDFNEIDREKKATCDSLEKPLVEIFIEEDLDDEISTPENVETLNDLMNSTETEELLKDASIIVEENSTDDNMIQTDNSEESLQRNVSSKDNILLSEESIEKNISVALKKENSCAAIDQKILHHECLNDHFDVSRISEILSDPLRDTCKEDETTPQKSNASENTSATGFIAEQTDAVDYRTMPMNVGDSKKIDCNTKAKAMCLRSDDMIGSSLKRDSGISTGHKNDFVPDKGNLSKLQKKSTNNTDDEDDEVMITCVSSAGCLGEKKDAVSVKVCCAADSNTAKLSTLLKCHEVLDCTCSCAPVHTDCLHMSVDTRMAARKKKLKKPEYLAKQLKLELTCPDLNDCYPRNLTQINEKWSTLDDFELLKEPGQKSVPAEYTNACQNLIKRRIKAENAMSSRVETLGQTSKNENDRIQIETTRCTKMSPVFTSLMEESKFSVKCDSDGSTEACSRGEEPIIVYPSDYVSTSSAEEERPSFCGNFFHDNFSSSERRKITSSLTKSFRTFNDCCCIQPNISMCMKTYANEDLLNRPLVSRPIDSSGYFKRLSGERSSKKTPYCPCRRTNTVETELASKNKPLGNMINDVGQTKLSTFSQHTCQKCSETCKLCGLNKDFDYSDQGSRSLVDADSNFSCHVDTFCPTGQLKQLKRQLANGSYRMKKSREVTKFKRRLANLFLKNGLDAINLLDLKKSNTVNDEGNIINTFDDIDVYDIKKEMEKIQKQRIDARQRTRRKREHMNEDDKEKLRTRERERVRLKRAIMNEEEKLFYRSRERNRARIKRAIMSSDKKEEERRKSRERMRQLRSTMTDEEKKLTRESSRLRMQEYRQRMYANPALANDFKQRNRERQRTCRLQKKVNKLGERPSVNGIDREQTPNEVAAVKKETF